jgi:hypothetical protein
VTVYQYAKHDIRFDSANNKFYFMFRQQRFNTLQGKPFTLPLWAVRTILHLIGWKCMQYKPGSRLYEITHPNGSRVNISLSTARWLVACAIHNDAVLEQQEMAEICLTAAKTCGTI